MNKDHFAKTFGFYDYEEMLANTTTVFQDTNIAWCVSKLPRGEFLAWDDAEIADDRVELFSDKDAAEDYLNILRNMAKMEENLKH